MRVGLRVRVRVRLRAAGEGEGSMGVRSSWFSTRSSGARYHRVTTYSVRPMSLASTSGLTGLARPKSQILRSQFLLTSRLPGLREGLGLGIGIG